MSKTTGPPKAPLVLLGLLSVATMAGPFLIFLVIRGGASQDWPPDRPAEWWTFGGVVAAVVVLTAACVTSGVWSKRGGENPKAENSSADNADQY